MKTILALLLLTLSALAGPLPSRPVHVLTVESSLRERLALPGQRTVRLGKSIAITKPLWIPANVEIIPEQFLFVKGAANATIHFDGPLTHGRFPCFLGWSPGDIRGTFAGQAKFPEWWHVAETRRDDIAINCAIQSTPILMAGNGNFVSLGARTYYLKSDLSMEDTYTSLIGAGGSRTFLETVPGWKPAKWRNANHPGWKAHPEGNHAFVIGIGGKTGNEGCYFSVVDGVTINCYPAAISNWDRYVSGISSVGPVQENSRIHDVDIRWATGSAIGFPGHDGDTSQLNGLRITSVWLTGGMKRETVPVLFSLHTNNTLLESFTIATPVDQAQTEDPLYPRTWAQIGIIAKGTNLTIRKGHFEGCQTGIAVMQGHGINTVTIEDMDFLFMMDASQTSTWDGKGFLSHENPYDTAASLTYKRPDPAKGIWDYSCGVLVASSFWDADRNYRDHIKIEGLHSQGQLTCLLRDRAAGVCVDSLGQQQYPAAMNGGLTHYSRGDMFTPGGRGVFDPATPRAQWDREYFTLRR